MKFPETVVSSAKYTIKLIDLVPCSATDTQEAVIRVLLDIIRNGLNA